MKLAMGGQLKKVRHYIWEHTPDKFDKEKFKAKMEYIIQLWQLKL